jgi:transposase
MRWTPVFGRLDKVELRGWEAPYKEQDDGREATSFGAAFKAKVALAAAKGDPTTAQLASQFGIHTSQVTAWKKQLMAQVAEPFADGRQRRADQATDEQELCEQIGRLKIEVEWVKKSCRGRLRSSGNASIRTTST